MIYQIQHETVQEEAEVLHLFLNHYGTAGSDARGAIIAQTFKDCDLYLDAAAQLLEGPNPGHVIRTRGRGCVAGWLFPDGAQIRLDYMPSLNTAYLNAGRYFSFLVFHDPEAWAAPEIMAYFLGLLRSPTVPTRLVTVKSPLALPDTLFKSKASAPAPVDYSSITRSICG